MGVGFYIFISEIKSNFLFPPTSAAELCSPSRENGVHIGMFKQSIERHIFRLVAVKSLSLPQLERVVTRNRILKSPNLSNLRRGFRRVAGGAVRRRQAELVVGRQQKVAELRQRLGGGRQWRRGDRGDLLGETLDDGIQILGGGIGVGILEEVEEVVSDSLDLRRVGVRVVWVDSEAFLGGGGGGGGGGGILHGSEWNSNADQKKWKGEAALRWGVRRQSGEDRYIKGTK